MLLEAVRGVGARTAEQFQAAGIETVGELVTFLPRAFEDFSEVTNITDLHPGKVTIKARCETISTRPVRRGMKITTATFADDTGKIRVVWFNQAYRAAQFAKAGGEFYLSGEFEFQYNRYQLTNPSAEKVSDLPVQTDRILPIYRSIKGLKSHVVRKILAELRPFITMLPETLPLEIITDQKIISYSEALLGMHFPKTVDEVARAKERLAFEEIFQLLLASQLNRQANAKLEGWTIPFDQAVIGRAHV